jgi:hypothetical protein
MPTLVDVPSLGRIEFPDGMNDDAIASSIKDLLSKQQGGEQNEQSQPEANTDSNEQLQGNKQVQSANEAGLQPSEVQLPESQGQEQLIGNVNPDLSISAPFQIGGENIAKTEQAKEGSQGQEDGKGLRGQVPSGNQTQIVNSATSVPSAMAKKPSEPEEGNLLDLATRGIAKGVYEFGEAAASMSAAGGNPLVNIAKNAEWLFGKNKFSDEVFQKGQENIDFFKNLSKSMDINETENKSLLDSLAFSTAKMIPDLLAAGLTGGESAVASGAKAAEGIVKPIAEKAIHGMVAFTAPSIKSAELAINKAKEDGESDVDALTEGMKTLVETEIGAALPMNVSSGLKNMVARGASRFLQAYPLSVAQQEMGIVLNNMFAKEGQRQPSLTENIIEGNFDAAGRQLAEATPMALLGILGENTNKIKPEIIEAGLPETAAVIEESAITQPKVRYSSETQLLEDTTRRLNELKAKPAEELTAEEATELDFLRMVPSTEELAAGYGVSVRKPTYSSEEIIQSKIADATTELESLSAKETLNQREAKRKTRLENEIQKNQELLDTGKTLEAETARKEAAKNKTQPNEEQVQETSGVSTEQGKPLVETTAVQTEEGTAQRQSEGQEEVVKTPEQRAEEMTSFSEANSPEEVDAFLNRNIEDSKLIQETKVRNKFVNDARKEAIARNKQLMEEAKQKPVVTSLDNGKPRATPKKEKPLPKKPKGKRLLAAAYKRPSDGQVFYGANHKEALLDAGMSWKDVQSKYGNPSQRESPEFGYKTDSNEFVTRREAEQVGAISKQIDVAGREADKQLGLDLHSNRLSLDEFPAFKAPEFSMGAARPSEFGDKKAFQDTLVKGTQAHESIKGEVTFEKWKSAFLSGLKKGGQFTESQLKSIFQESEGLNAYAKSFGKNPADIIDFPDLWSGKSAAEIEALSKSKRPEDIDLTNQNIDQLREGLGFEPIMRQEAEKWGNVWKEAMLQINANTATIPSLISQLRTRPRALTPVEKATLRYATLDALHTLDQKTRLLASATDRVEQKKYNQEYEQASRDLNELLEIESRTASASGLSLNAVKLINRANFNVTSMINQYKAAKKTYTKMDGKAETRLSDAEITKIREQSKALVDALKARDEALQEAKILEADKSISDLLEAAKKDRKAGEKITDLSVDEQISQYTMEIETADGDSMNRGVAIRGLARALSEKLNTTDVAVVSEEVHTRIKDIMGKEWNENTTKDALAGNGIFGQTTKSGAFGSLRTLERRRANFERDLKIAMKAKTQKERDLKMAKLLERNRVDVKELEPQIQDLTEVMMTRISKLMGDLKNNELRPCE